MLHYTCDVAMHHNDLLHCTLDFVRCTINYPGVMLHCTMYYPGVMLHCNTVHVALHNTLCCTAQSRSVRGVCTRRAMSSLNARCMPCRFSGRGYARKIIKWPKPIYKIKANVVVKIKISTKISKMSRLTLKEVAKILELPPQRIYHLDGILKPTYVDRGSKMKARLYDPEHVQAVKPIIDSLKIKPDIDKGRVYRRRHITPEDVWRKGVDRYWNTHLHGVRGRSLSNELERVDFERLIQMRCTYCDGKPQKRKAGGYLILANGIDRVDNSKGYVTSNCVPCCMRCNRMKSNMSVADFLDHVHRIAMHV